MDLEEIILGLRDNDRNCQRVLFFQYAKLISAVCRRYRSGVAPDLEDTVQEVFIQIFKSISLYDPAKGEFESWMKTIAIRTTIRTYRKRRIRVEPIEDYEPIASEATGYDHLLELDVWKIINSLPVHYRQIFLMFVVDGLTHEEISEALSININTSRSKLMRARNLLQQYLGKLEKVPDYES